MTRTIRITLAYDGTDFHGWQRQPNVRTVQQEVEQAVIRIVRHPTSVLGASRTDAGVHAQGQVACFRTESEIPPRGLANAIAHRLPEDIALVQLRECSDGFHPSRDALGKLYRYRIFNSALRPASRNARRDSWHVWYALDAARMAAAAARMIGTHDFAGFQSAGNPRASTIRTVRRVQVRRRFDELLIDVEGDGFLYNQVRNMVGTLYEIGRGHWPVERIDEILATGDRRRAGRTAPAAGLCLQWVRYGAAPLVDEQELPPACEPAPQPVIERAALPGEST